MATGKAKNTEERRTTAARSKTAAAKRVTTQAPKLPWYRRLFHNVGPLEIVIAGVCTALTVWAWLAFVVTQPQDYMSFVIVYAIAMIGGSIVHFVLPFLFGWAGVLTSKLGRAPSQDDGAEKTSGGSGVVYWGPVVISVIVFLIVTPPNTPTGDTDSFASIYQVILVMGLLGLAGVGLGMLVIVLIAMPILWIIVAVLPDRRPRDVIARDPMSRLQYAAMGGIMLLIVGLAVSMNFVGTGGVYTTSSRHRMWLEFITLITLRGDPIASALAVLSIAGIVVLGIVNNRAVAKRPRERLAAMRNE